MSAFPWLDHLDLREVAVIEQQRAHFADSEILTYHEKIAPHIGRERVRGFLHRNPRKRSEAA